MLFITRVKREVKRVHRNGCRDNERLKNAETVAGAVSGPGSARLKTAQAAYLNRFTNELIADPVLKPLLGPFPALFRVDETFGGAYCSTVSTQRHNLIDPLTLQPTEVPSSTFKILQSNCVENAKKEMTPCSNMITHADRVKLMTGDRILNNVQDHGCRCKRRGKWHRQPRTFDAKKRPGGARCYQEAENDKENARVNEQRHDESEDDDMEERRIRKSRSRLDAVLEGVANRRSARSSANGGNGGNANAADISIDTESDSE